MSAHFTVILLHNPKEQTRGQLRRYCYEIKPNVFVGTISRRVRELLWEELNRNHEKTTLIFPCNNEQSFDILSNDENANTKLVDLYGVILPTRSASRISHRDLFAKPNMLLLDHCMETGYIAEAIMREGPAKTVIDALAEQFTVNKDNLISSITFLCAAHDIGKAHPSFIAALARTNPTAQIKDVYEKLTTYGLLLDDHESFRHERYSRVVLRNYLQANGFSSQIIQFTDLIPFHHQGKVLGINEEFKSPGTAWELAQTDILNTIISKWPITDDLEKISACANGASYYILSILVTSDWITSGQAWEEHKKTHPANHMSAIEFLSMHHMKHCPLETRFQTLTWDRAFSFAPNEMQRIVINEAKAGFDFMLVEAPCGHGKTEAALAGAFLSGKAKSGIYMAAPTTATAKALKNRARTIADDAGLEIQIPEFDNSAYWSDDEMDRIPKELWPSKSRHQMLFPFAVGTIDQLLKAVGSFRYSCIGLLGLSDKAVIVDEVHAYDAYMLRELEELIRWCRFLKVPIILLSATLPTKTRKRLIRAAGASKKSILSQEYPLITSCRNGNIQQRSFACGEREIILETEETDSVNDLMLEKALELKAGCLALINDTVDHAWDLYDKIDAIHTNTEVVLFHGRDSVSHKTNKTNQIVKLLGKDRANRPQKYILVSTSIIEQSLDIDTDYMNTVLAPIDLLIQRIGRFHRHSDTGTIREKANIPEAVTIIIPRDMSTLNGIYNEEILQNTINVLKQYAKIRTVKDIRTIIDTVYDTTSTQEDLASQLNAGRHIVTNPFCETINILECSDTAYERFDKNEACTREESYPTTQLAIVTQQEAQNETYENARAINQHKVINMASKKLDSLHIDWVKNTALPGIRLYISENNTVIGVNSSIEFTEDGLKWTKRTNNS